MQSSCRETDCNRVPGSRFITNVSMLPLLIFWHSEKLTISNIYELY